MVGITLRRRRRRRRRDDRIYHSGGVEHAHGDGGDGDQRSHYGATVARLPHPVDDVDIIIKSNDDSSFDDNYDPRNGKAMMIDDGAMMPDYEKDDDYDDDDDDDDDDDERSWPTRRLLIKASCIALFDIFAQSMVYTGNNLAGPTIFSIIYSSVTIWAAIYSKFILSRSLSIMQWTGVFLVVIGLSITALDSLTLGNNVFLGACLIVVGTSFHGLTYVFSEMIMTSTTVVDDDANDDESMMQRYRLPSSSILTTRTDDDHRIIDDDNARVRREYTRLQRPRHQRRRRNGIISVRANCAIQGLVAMIALLAWQVIYTLPRIRPLILVPMMETNTTLLCAFSILSAIALSNLFHSIAFFVTLKHLAGGATSAGVLKGLQAVLVFCASSIFLCGRWDGDGGEMCWSASKLVSLAVVLCGIMLYTRGTYGTSETKTMDEGGVLCV